MEVRTLFSPSPRSGLILAASISLLLSVAALILFLNNALSSFFFQPIFISLDFSLLMSWCRGAVFRQASAFNGDLSAWQVGKVGTMYESTYTLFPPSPRSGLSFGCFYISLLLSVAALILFLNNALSPLLFSNPFLSWTLLFVAVVQCLSLLMPSMVISPRGRSGK